jgi:AcrR family transcriptional regulator
MLDIIMSQRRAAPRAAGRDGTSAARASSTDEVESESRKQAILDAAAEIFHRKGYHATSIQDIAQEVGMLKGSLYYYIDSKHELLLKIITDVHAQAFQQLEEFMDSDLPAAERLRQFIIRHAVYCATHMTGMGVFLHEYKAVEGPARAEVMAMRDRYEMLLRGIIEDGKEDGTFRADVDARLAVKLVLGMVNWLYHWYSPDGPLAPEEIGEAMANMALRGIEA